jgi:AcrR family transcriptional regulator
MTEKQPKKRTQAQRRQHTQQKILSATLEILVEEGYANCTTSKVAKRAGVSRGAQENYFRTKVDLITAATKFAMSRAEADIGRSAIVAHEKSDVLDAFLKDTQKFIFSRTYIAMVELAIAGRHDRHLSHLHRNAFLHFQRVRSAVWGKFFAQAGYSRKNADIILRLSVHLLRGMAFTKLMVPGMPSDRPLLNAWRAAVLQRLATDPNNK